MTDRPIFFMHIAKTAGTSLNRLFSDLLGDAARVHIEGGPITREMLETQRFVSGHLRYPVFRRFSDGIDYRFVTLLRDPVEHLRSHLNWVKIQTTDRRHRAFVAQNEPIRRLSQELQAVNIGKPGDIRRFLDGNLDDPHCVNLFQNCQTRYFVQAPGDRCLTDADHLAAIAATEAFDFVGISEMFETSVERLAAILDLPLRAGRVKENVARYGRRFDREEFRDVLSDYVGYDIALYELVKTRFLRAI